MVTTIIILVLIAAVVAALVIGVQKNNDTETIEVVDIPTTPVVESKPKAKTATKKAATKKTKK